MSARLRLTLTYAGFLMVAALAFIALVFYILRFVPEGTIVAEGSPFVPDRQDLLDALWPRIWQVLSVLVIIGLVGGWLLAGRMLRPLQRINGIARSVAAGSLDQRVRLDGPRDEFRELADTFDFMLDRLQGAFNEQRRFAANAAHELRTPYAIERSMLDVALADPAGVDVDELVRRLDETNRRGIEVVEALLALAAMEDGRSFERSPVDIAETVDEVVRELRPLANSAGVSVTTTLGEGDIDGNATLVRQLIANLVLNGIRHNLDTGGWLRVQTVSTTSGFVELSVVNSGPVVQPGVLATLTEPFVRGAGRVTTTGRSGHEGSGLGLALVSRVARAHDATLHLDAPASGGLVVSVRFRGPDAPAPAARP